MATVRIITDITAHIDSDLIAKHQITVLPVEIRFGDQLFRITARDDWDRFFRHIADSPAKSAEASVPNSVLQDAYNRLARETEEILVLPGSSKLSNSFA